MAEEEQGQAEGPDRIAVRLCPGCLAENAPEAACCSACGAVWDAAPAPVPATDPEEADGRPESKASVRRWAAGVRVLGLLGGCVAVGLGAARMIESPNQLAFGFVLMGLLALGVVGWSLRQRAPGMVVLASLATVNAAINLVVLALIASKIPGFAVALYGALSLTGPALLIAGYAKCLEEEEEGGDLFLIFVLWGLGMLAIAVSGAVFHKWPAAAMRASALVTALLAIALWRFMKEDRLFRLPRPWIHAVWPVAAALVLGWSARQYLLLLVNGLGPADPAFLKWFADLTVADKLLLFVLLIPAAEEVIFRGAMQSVFRRAWGPATAVVASALVFAVAHANPVAVPVLLVVGLTLGLAREYSRSLLPCIALHAIYNAVVLL